MSERAIYIRILMTVLFAPVQKRGAPAYTATLLPYKNAILGRFWGVWRAEVAEIWGKLPLVPVFRSARPSLRLLTGTQVPAVTP